METKKASHLSLVVQPSAPARRARFVCLLVEDDANALALAELLEVDDLEVVTANSACEALHILAERRVDIVVVEQHLPGENGNHLLEAIRFRWPRIGRVLLSGELGPDVLLQAINRARVQCVLYKKMSAQSLRAEIEAVLNETLFERAAEQRARC